MSDSARILEQLPSRLVVQADTDKLPLVVQADTDKLPEELHLGDLCWRPAALDAASRVATFFALVVVGLDVADPTPVIELAKSNADLFQEFGAADALTLLGHGRHSS